MNVGSVGSRLETGDGLFEPVEPLCELLDGLPDLLAVCCRTVGTHGPPRGCPVGFASVVCPQTRR